MQQWRLPRRPRRGMVSSGSDGAPRRCARRSTPKTWGRWLAGPSRKRGRGPPQGESARGAQALTALVSGQAITGMTRRAAKQGFGYFGGRVGSARCIFARTPSPFTTDRRYLSPLVTTRIQVDIRRLAPRAAASGHRVCQPAQGVPTLRPPPPFRGGGGRWCVSRKCPGGVLEASGRAGGE